VSPTFSTFLFEAANFLLLAALLGWLFFRPVRAALEQRRAGLEAAQRDAEAGRAEAQRLLDDAQARRGRLEASLAELRDKLRKEAESERDRLLAAAREQAQRERDALKAELAAQRRSQARALSGDAASAAREILVRLLAQVDGPELERSLLDAAGRRLTGLASNGPLTPVIVESAEPLVPDALEALARAVGCPASALGQRVVPDLVAGVRVLTARGLVDASAAGLAAHAEQTLLARLDTEEDARG
jgi:F-type H+-transporting ATPase subunit b